jgi:Ca2+-binding EF-hand superfamily protein
MIKFSEFLAAAMEENSYHAEDKLVAAFHKLDLDDSGVISYENLRDMLPKDLPKATVDKIIAEADFNKDGSIDLAEFKAAMAGSATATSTLPPAGTAKALRLSKQTNL